MAEIIIVSVGVIPACITGITTWWGFRYKYKNKNYIKLKDLKNHKIFDIDELYFYVPNESNTNENIILNMFKKRYKLIKQNLSKVLDLNITEMKYIDITDLIYNIFMGKDIFTNINDERLYQDINPNIINKLGIYEMEIFNEYSEFLEQMIHSTFFCKVQKICFFLNIYEYCVKNTVKNFDDIIKNLSIKVENNMTISKIDRINNIYKNIIKDCNQKLDKFLFKIDNNGIINFIYADQSILEYTSENILGKNIITMLSPGEIDTYFNFLSNDEKNINHKIILKNKAMNVTSIKYNYNFILLFIN